MRTKYNVITIGGITEDVFFTVDDYLMINNQKDLLHKKMLAFEYGAKIGVPEVTCASGGGAANASVAFSRLGFRAAIIGVVSHDSRGRNLVHNLLKNRVRTNLLEINDQTQTGVSFILVKPGNDHIVFTHRGANDFLKLNFHQLQAIKKTEWIYLTSLSEDWQSVLKAVFSNAKLVAWNPGRLQIMAGLKALTPFLEKTEVLICNKDEAIELVSSASGNARASSLNNTKFLLRSLKKFVFGTVIITNGEQGSMLYDGQKIYQQKIIKVRKVVDTTGVGDAFGASYVAGLKIFQGNKAKALALAAKNSSAVVGQFGAQTGLMARR
jgi:sugar/nucleoside kinase (ribokinase family)